MNKTQVIKYFRVSEDKQSLILLPSKVGIDIIKDKLTKSGYAFTETIEKIDKSNLLAIKLDLGSEVKYFKHDFGRLNVASIYIFTMNEAKFYINYPFEV